LNWAEKKNKELETGEEEEEEEKGRTREENWKS
jgi:hypothetical protein